MTRVLSTGEWRLFLMSECIKYYPEVDEHTRALRKSGKHSILTISGDDSKELDYFLTKEDGKKIRAMLRKEWRFTGAVRDNGRGNKTTCEYCQKQQIRYRYLCRNDKTDSWLSLGSVCVGYVIHGEEKMKDTEFSRKFVAELEGMKGNSHQFRDEQFKEVQLYIQYLRGKGITTENDGFLEGIQKHWSRGNALSEGQMIHLKNMCKKQKYKGGVYNG